MINQDNNFSIGKNLINLGIILSFILIFVLILLGVVTVQNKIKEYKYIGKDAIIQNTISVTGTGEFFAKPDIATINFSVIVESRSAMQAIQENTEKMNNLISYLKEQGIEEKDLKTIGFNLYPKYDFNTPARTPIGYEASQNLDVKIRNLDNIGTIIQGATANGANSVGQLNFLIDNTDELKKQARTLAIKEAKNRARELSAQLGVGLGRIVGFSEDSSDFPVYPFFKDAALGGATTLETPLIPQIETGENQVLITVHIIYELI